MSVERPPRQGVLRHLGHRGCLRLPVPIDVAGILNAGRRPRRSVIVDLWPSPMLQRLLAAGEAGLGLADPSGHAQLVRLTRQRCGGPWHRLERPGRDVGKWLRHRG